MHTNYSDLVNATFTSSRQSLEGHYFYDSMKEAWFKVKKSCFVFVSFDFSFGSRWNTCHHEILDVEKCSAKQSEHLNNCSMEEFAKLKA
jgi:hypothetical protein